VLPFSVELRPGLPVAEQIMFAVRKAVVTRQLRPGDKFPSVRVLSQALKVNPNTAHKVVAAWVAEGVLVTTPAVGSIVAEREIGGKKERAELLGVEVECSWWRRKNSDSISTMCRRRWRRIGRNLADDDGDDEPARKQPAAEPREIPEGCCHVIRDKSAEVRAHRCHVIRDKWTGAVGGEFSS
jgi:GntR family transcriptional regulator